MTTPPPSWGRWGEADERGALNLIGSDEVLLASHLIKEGVCIDLGQPISRATPVPKNRPRISHRMLKDGVRGAGASHTGFRYADDEIEMPVHSGTHVDAFSHVWCGGTLYNGFSSETVTPSAGATRCGIEKLGPIVGRGVLLDATEGQVPMEGGRVISSRSLETIVARNDVELFPGDIVLIRTGWNETEHIGPDAYFAGEPGLDLTAARWLTEQGVAVVGADNFALEAIPFSGSEVFPVHKFLLRDCGIPIIEELNLRDLALRQRTSFFFAALPLKIIGGTGSPVSPIVIL